LHIAALGCAEAVATAALYKKEIQGLDEAVFYRYRL